MPRQIVLVLLLFFSRNAKCIETYEGYKVYEVVPETLEQLDILHAYSDTYDFWKESQGVGSPSHVMVAPEGQATFESILSRNGFNFEIGMDNVETVLAQERVERMTTRSLLSGDISFSSFMTFGEHMAYLRRLATDYPSLTTLETLGYSYEGQEILLLRISGGPNTGSIPKPVILIDAGIHCREWIAPPVALYLINQLVENSTNSALYENVDWIVIPNLNPDGYDFTQSDDRLWRKNRRLVEGNACYGTDLNRNFGHHWMHQGASNDSCTQTYAGDAAFSEPEAAALRDFVLANLENLRLYLTVHSYGEWFLYPWGYTYPANYTENTEEHQLLGERAGEAIAAATTIGSSYVIGNSAELLYAAAGASDDWVKSQGVDLSYTIELPNGDAPYYFMIPARQIYTVAQETFEAFKVFHNYIEEKYWTNVTALLRGPVDNDLLL